MMGLLVWHAPHCISQRFLFSIPPFPANTVLLGSVSITQIQCRFKLFLQLYNHPVLVPLYSILTVQYMVDFYGTLYDIMYYCMYIHCNLRLSTDCQADQTLRRKCPSYVTIFHDIFNITRYTTASSESL